MYTIDFNWKSFSVRLDRMHKYFKSICTEYDGMVATEEKLEIILLSYNEADIIRIDAYWDSLTVESENELNQYELRESVQNIISKAMDFGKQVMVEFSAENVLMGITQQNKTKQVITFLNDVKNAMDTGSLYIAIDEIDKIVNLGIPEELSPFITEERLMIFKQKIQSYLEI